MVNRIFRNWVAFEPIRNILRYSDKNSIVLGDEICKGTEETSALSIVYASIKKLVENNVNFILFEHHYDDMIVKNYFFSDIHDFLSKNNFKKIYKSKMPFRKTFEYIYVNKNYKKIDYQ